MVGIVERNPQQNPEFEQRKQGLVIAAQGEISIKVVDGKRQRVIPFVGAEKLGKVLGKASQIGVGILLPDAVNEGQFWGLTTQRKVIQSWRGMKILEHVEVIEDGTLDAAWYASGQEVDPNVQRHIIDELSSKIGKEKFQALRTEILDKSPSAVELQKMLTTFKANQVEVDGLELQQEVAAGRIASSPLIEELIAKDERERQRRRRFLRL